MGMDVEKKNRVLWVDIAKFFAIIAVMTDHLHGVLYTNNMLQQTTFFSVSLFIVLSGIILYWEFDKDSNCIRYKVKKRIITMIESYVFACFIYYIYYSKSFDWKSYIDSILKFNLVGPLYFVLLYLQLIIISPILYYFLNSILRAKYAWLFEILVGVTIIFVSRWLNMYTNIYDVYGGGGRLFGGTYLFILYVGMLCGKYYEYTTKLGTVCKWVLALITFALTIIYVNAIWENGLIFDNYSLLGTSVNPPGITLTIYALLIMLLIYFWVDILFKDRSMVFAKARAFMAWVGQNTLSIFLYHFLFLEIAKKCFGAGNDIWGKTWRIMVYYIGMILGSIIIGKIFRQIKKIIIKSYRLNA